MSEYNRSVSSINKLVSESRELLCQAYDKGYEQGKTGYEKRPGHWVMKFDSKYGTYECSECFVRNFVPSRFCPDCGARMNKVVKKEVKNEKNIL